MALSKTTKLVLLLTIDILFFLVELIVGFSVHSLALVADAFHMFNDILSLLVGVWAIRVATKRGSSRVYTYGWQRAETLGALINGVFLIALCMSIFLEAIQRFAEPQEVSNPKLILIVGCTGLASNFVGILLLHEHEEPGPEANSTPERLIDEEERNAEMTPQRLKRAPTLSQISVHPASLRADMVAAGQAHIKPENSGQDTENTPLLTGEANLHSGHMHERSDGSKKGGKSEDLNMSGVFLHVLGDAVGNIGVIASALFIWLTDFSWRFYADPTVSVIITAIILHTAIPLCTAASRILLEAVPEGINIDDIKKDINTLPGIAGCHALHVSQLSDANVIASVHIEVDHKVIKDSHEQYMQLASAIRDCLSACGIHSATIQPEFFASTAPKTSTC